MSMKTSVVTADGTFATNTAPLLGGIEDVARKAAKLGYDAISLTVNRPEDVDTARILSACQQYGLTVSGLATGRICTVDGFSLGTMDEEKRSEAVRRMLAHADLCAQLGGAKLIIGAIRGWTKDAGGREPYERQLRKSIEAILAKAETVGIQVVFEAISRIDSDAYCSIAETAQYIRSFHSPALKLQLDSIHLHNNGELNFYEEILKCQGLVGQVDISDVDRMAPDGKHFDFPLFLKALKEINYQDYLVFEYRAGPPANAARMGLEYIRTLM